MIRDRLIRACIGLLFLGLIVLGAGVQRPFDRVTAPPAAAAPSATAAFEALPERFEIDISELVVNLRGKTQREIEDQLRDWAVYGTLIELGVDKDELGKATFKTAPVRLPNLEGAFVFDYSRGRRALLGDSETILFHDADDPDPVATLGRLADRVRMETGEIPGRFHVLTMAPDLAKNTIEIVRKPDVAGPTMFGSQYGYVEQSATNLGALQAWLARIDDVTFAGVHGGVLHLGGRRAPNSRTKNVTVDDIAALLQAQNAVAGERRKLEAGQARIDAEFQAEVQRNASAWTGSRRSEEEIRAVYEKKMAELEAEADPFTPGFSLDPQWSPAGLAKALDKAAQDPCAFNKEALDVLKAGEGTETDSALFTFPSSASSSPVYTDLSSPGTKIPPAVCSAARAELGPELRAMATAVRAAQAEADPGRRAGAMQRAMRPLWASTRELRSRPRSDATSLRLALLNHLQARHQIQCARYDGPLAGTHVGMNLFYTDLLAKLWQGVDLHHESPGVHVPGLLSSPRMSLERQRQAEDVRSPNTRIWFGPKPDGHARSEAGDSVWFEHIATRMFAAGSDPANPGSEERPTEESRRSLTWWDRHYEAVADYEQQYHVQNQIEKWSLVTGWWREQLQYLTSFPVDHEQRFDRWYDREKPTLRYQFAIPLRPESEWVTNTECIDLLSSYPFVDLGSGTIRQIQGGVRLGGRRPAKGKGAPKVRGDSPEAPRRAGAKAPDAPGKSAGVWPIYQEPGKAAALLKTTLKTTPLKTTPLRTTALKRMGAPDADLRKITVSHARSSKAGATITLRSDKGTIGSIIGRRAHGGVGLRWSPGEVYTKLVRPPPSEGPTDASRPPVKGALDALKVGDQRKVLAQLSRASEGGPARLRADLGELRARSSKDADAWFAAGDARAANRGYQVSEALGRLTASSQMLHALAEIQLGQVKRGLARLEELEDAKREELVSASAGKPGLEELQELTKAQIDRAPTLFGKTANEVKVTSKGANLDSVLVIDRGSERAPLPLVKRVAMLQAHRQDLVVYVEGFSFNSVDFETAAPGTLTELARSPNVTWSVVTDAGGAFKPSLLVEGSKTIYRMTSPRQPGSAVDYSAAIRAASHVVIIRNCDVDHDGRLSDAERAACDCDADHDGRLSDAERAACSCDADHDGWLSDAEKAACDCDADHDRRLSDAEMAACSCDADHDGRLSDAEHAACNARLRRSQK